MKNFLLTTCKTRQTLHVKTQKNNFFLYVMNVYITVTVDLCPVFPFSLENNISVFVYILSCKNNTKYKLMLRF